ncbi:uncharacterized protein VTP21DRAFT_5444 [Calcarisporiella thermophila]|uniref:uncharacterized protein n=1 Tax=Calcarisporiella thermophila TaxID=911321 RepID=UPI0037429AB6
MSPPNFGFIRKYFSRNGRTVHIDPAVDSEKSHDPMRTWKQKLDIWLINEGYSKIFVGVWIISQILLFVYGFIQAYFSDNYRTAQRVAGVTYGIARGAAMCLHVDSGIVLFPMCRNLLSWFRSSNLNKVVQFDKHIAFHKLVGWSIFFFGLLHTICHYVNFVRLARTSPNVVSQFFYYMFGHGVGWSGHVLIIVILIMGATSVPSVRRSNFERFWYTHHLFVIYFIVFSFHGAFCLVANDRPPLCVNIASFWKYWIASGVIYTFERVIREYRAFFRRSHVSKIVLHPSKVVEIQIKKENTFSNVKAGQYVFICCPEVSIWQWHPFTLTSAPEEDYISVHVRVVGDFTRNLARALGCGDGDRVEDANNQNGRQEVTKVLPRIMVDGPFGTSSEDVFNFEVAMLVGAGIGVTPFASILKSIWYRLNYPTKSTKLRKVYFIWICREYAAFEWFQSLLKQLEQEDIKQFISIRTYLTGKLRHSYVRNILLNSEPTLAEPDPITGLQSPTYYGRPNFQAIFEETASAHPDTDIGVFFCGPEIIAKNLADICRRDWSCVTTSANPPQSRHRASAWRKTMVEALAPKPQTITGVKFFFHQEHF